MITVGMNYSVLAGKEQEFEDRFTAVLSALKSATGHNDSHLYQDVSDRSSYLIVSQWSDESAFREFIQSPMFKDVTDWGKEQILAGRPLHKIYRN